MRSGEITNPEMTTGLTYLSLSLALLFVSPQALRGDKQPKDISLSVLSWQPEYWKGHTYRVSGPVTNDIDAKIAICNAAGGYLMEIDDAEEYNLAQRFRARTYYDLTVSGTNEGHHRRWTFSRPGMEYMPMPFLRWARHEPSNSGNCIDLVYDRMRGTYNMNDYNCYRKYKSAFVCELPFE